VSTNLIKQISRRFPGDSRRDFKKNPGHVSLASASFGDLGERHKLPTGVRGRAPAENGFWCISNLKNTSDGDKFCIFATNIHPYFYDRKPMRSIFDILHKNFQEDQLNSRRFPGFPGFPGVVDTLVPMRHFLLTCSDTFAVGCTV